MHKKVQILTKRPDQRPKLSDNEKTKENDLALLRLSSPVEFSDYIRPVCLAAKGSFFPDGLSSWVTGWGDVQTGSEDGCGDATMVVMKLKDTKTSSENKRD